MKKALFLSFFLLLWNVANAQVDLPITFELDPDVYELTDFGGNASEIVEDPTDAANNVVQTTKTDGAETWAGTTVADVTGFSSPLPFEPGSTTMSVRVWSPTADTPIRLKVEDINDVTVSVETEAMTTVAGEWETLVFDFANEATGTAAIDFDASYTKASIFFNFGTEGDDQTYYWDDMELGGEGTGPSAPPVPVGFVANPSDDSGTVFLAVGPNNVGGDIAYRLFYATSSENVDDPRTATEYQFGSTAGDGEGINAFGFNLEGLDPGIEYTFWLYQYNSSAELFSDEPATATQTAGGEGNGTDPTGGEIDFPITFDDDELDYELVDFGGNASEIVTDPTDAENSVVQTTKSEGAEEWAGTTVADETGFAAPIPFEPGSTTMSVRVWSPTADTPIRLKVENVNDGTVSVETEAMTTVAEEWETLVFDFSNEATGTAAINFDASYTKASIFFNFGTAGEGLTYYWDDMELGGEGTGPSAPPVPEGFVANESDDSGVVFLAVGPNNVGGDIVYRLFYALSSEGVDDPRTASEYEFGNTPGDGDGINAFGFNLEGLDPGAEYTFWLYQYNSSAELFSDEPATATQTAGGDGDDTDPPPGGEIEFPITFDDDELDYELVDFGGNASEIVTDPTDSENNVVQTTKTDGAETWAGTTVGDETGFAAPIPFEPGSTTMSVRVWSPTADIPVRLKVEDVNDPTVSVETEAMTTVAEEWETLVFDFSNQADGTEAINFDASYTKASIFFNFGSEGEGLTYYWDDMELGENGDVTPPEGVTVSLPITFEEDDIDWENAFVDFDGGSATVIDNPDQSELNPSDRVAQMVKGAGQPWGGSYMNLTEPIVTDDDPISMMVWAPRENTTVLFKIENSDDPSLFYEVEQSIPASGEWTEMSFDLSGADSGVDYDRLVLIFDLGTEGDGSADFTWYFDNIDYETATNIVDDFNEIPAELSLNQNYPNPFNPTTQITFALPENSDVRLDVYNITGQRVASLVNQPMSAGSHSITFDASGLSSGIYFYRLQNGTNILTRKMTLLK